MGFIQLTKALHSYESKAEDEFSFKIGDRFLVIEQTPSGWLSGVVYIPGREILQKDIKLIPSTYVDKQKPIGTAVTKYEYEGRGWDELSLKLNSVLDIYDNSDSQWWLAAIKNTDQIGIVPVVYLENYTEIKEDCNLNPTEYSHQPAPEPPVQSNKFDEKEQLLPGESFLVIYKDPQNNKLKKECFLTIDDEGIVLSEIDNSNDVIERWNFADLTHFSTSESERSLKIETVDSSIKLDIDVKPNVNKIKNLIQNGIISSKVSPSLKEPFQVLPKTPSHSNIPQVAIVTKKFKSLDNESMVFSPGEHVVVLDSSDSNSWLVRHLSKISSPTNANPKCLQLTNLTSPPASKKSSIINKTPEPTPSSPYKDKDTFRPSDDSKIHPIPPSMPQEILDGIKNVSISTPSEKSSPPYHFHPEPVRLTSTTDTLQKPDDPLRPINENLLNKPYIPPEKNVLGNKISSLTDYKPQSNDLPNLDFKADTNEKPPAIAERPRAQNLHPTPSVKIEQEQPPPIPTERPKFTDKPCVKDTGVNYAQPSEKTNPHVTSEPLQHVEPSVIADLPLKRKSSISKDNVQHAKNSAPVNTFQENKISHRPAKTQFNELSAPVGDQIQPVEKLSSTDKKRHSTTEKQSITQDKSSESPYRVWKDSTGSFTSVAKLLNHTPESDDVSLLKENGVKIVVPIKRLSLEDIEYLNHLSKSHKLQTSKHNIKHSRSFSNSNPLTSKQQETSSLSQNHRKPQKVTTQQNSASSNKPSSFEMSKFKFVHPSVSEALSTKSKSDSGSSSRHKATKDSSSEPKFNFNWEEFFINTGVSKSDSHTYAKAIKTSLSPGFTANKLNYSVLKNVIGASDADIIKIFNLLEAEEPTNYGQQLDIQNLLSTDKKDDSSEKKSKRSAKDEISSQIQIANELSKQIKQAIADDEVSSQEKKAREMLLKERDSIITELKKKRNETDETLKLAEEALLKARDEMVKTSLINEEYKRARAELALKRAQATARNALMMSIKAKEGYLKAVRDASFESQQEQQNISSMQAIQSNLQQLKPPNQPLPLTNAPYNPFQPITTNTSHSQYISTHHYIFNNPQKILNEPAGNTYCPLNNNLIYSKPEINYIDQLQARPMPQLMNQSSQNPLYNLPMLPTSNSSHPLQLPTLDSNKPPIISNPNQDFFSNVPTHYPNVLNNNFNPPSQNEYVPSNFDLKYPAFNSNSQNYQHPTHNYNQDQFNNNQDYQNPSHNSQAYSLGYNNRPAQPPTLNNPHHQQPSYNNQLPQAPINQMGSPYSHNVTSNNYFNSQNQMQPQYQQPQYSQPQYQQPQYQQPQYQQPQYSQHHQQPQYQQPQYPQPQYPQPQYPQPQYPQYSGAPTPNNPTYPPPNKTHLQYPNIPHYAPQ